MRVRFWVVEGRREVSWVFDASEERREAGSRTTPGKREVVRARIAFFPSLLLPPSDFRVPPFFRKVSEILKKQDSPLYNNSTQQPDHKPNTLQNSHKPTPPVLSSLRSPPCS